jgi:hypothetical protein
MAAARLAPLARETIADLLDRGLSDEEIARIGGIQPGSLRNRRLKLGLLRPPSAGPEWTAQEVRELRRLFARGLTDQEIAERLGRTAPNAIASRRFILGLVRLDEKPWTEEDNDALRRMWDTTATVREIAAVLGRSPGAVTQRRRRLGLEPRP